MKEVVVDVLFAGLLLIPIALYFFPFLTEKFISTFQQSVARSSSYLLSLPISVYLIYEMSTKSNLAAQIALVVAFFHFFTIYASALSYLFKFAGTNNKRLNSNND